MKMVPTTYLSFLGPLKKLRKLQEDLSADTYSGKDARKGLRGIVLSMTMDLAVRLKLVSEKNGPCESRKTEQHPARQFALDVYQTGKDSLGLAETSCAVGPISVSQSKQPKGKNQSLVLNAINEAMNTRVLTQESARDLAEKALFSAGVNRPRNVPETLQSLISNNYLFIGTQGEITPKRPKTGVLLRGSVKPGRPFLPKYTKTGFRGKKPKNNGFREWTLDSSLGQGLNSKGVGACHYQT